MTFISRIAEFARSHSRLVFACGAIATITLGSFAYAYFTSGGSGRATGVGVGANAALKINGTTSGTLYPGTSTPVSFTVDNPSTGHQQLGTIHLASVLACSGTISAGTCSGTEVTSCESVETGTSDTNSANFWMPDLVVNHDYATGNGQAVAGSPVTLTFNDLSTSQNACQNVNLQLTFSS